MKLFGLATITFFTFAAQIQAAEVSDDSITVARLLLNNPEISTQLRPYCADRLATLESIEIESGVMKHVLTFNQSRMCVPVSASVTIVENMKPTWHDGPPEYKTTIEIRSRTRGQ